MVAAQAMSFTLALTRIGSEPTRIVMLEAGSAVLALAAIYFTWGFFVELATSEKPDSE
jgi:hypothetical protein